MGTWGEGLYDNDSALDGLSGLVRIDGEEPDAARLVARIGLLAWFNPVSVTSDEDGELEARVEAVAADLARLPPETRAALESLLADPEAAIEERSRSDEARGVIGGYSNGPRIDALLRFEGARPVIDALAQRAVKWLDRDLSADIDLYQVAGSMAALGVLIELSQAGFWQADGGQVGKWRAGFDKIDKATKSERGFWWKYVRRVRAGFDILAPPPPGAAAGKADGKQPRSAGAPAAPLLPGQEQLQHARFGKGILVSRRGQGDEARLEIRFDDGLTRTVLAKSVSKV